MEAKEAKIKEALNKRIRKVSTLCLLKTLQIYFVIPAVCVAVGGNQVYAFIVALLIGLLIHKKISISKKRRICLSIEMIILNYKEHEAFRNRTVLLDALNRRCNAFVQYLGLELLASIIPMALVLKTSDKELILFVWLVLLLPKVTDMIEFVDMRIHKKGLTDFLSQEWFVD